MKLKQARIVAVIAVLALRLVACGGNPNGPSEGGVTLEGTVVGGNFGAASVRGASAAAAVLTVVVDGHPEMVATITNGSFTLRGLPEAIVHAHLPVRRGRDRAAFLRRSEAQPGADGHGLHRRLGGDPGRGAAERHRPRRPRDRGTRGADRRRGSRRRQPVRDRRPHRHRAPRHDHHPRRQPRPRGGRDHARPAGARQGRLAGRRRPGRGAGSPRVGDQAAGAGDRAVAVARSGAGSRPGLHDQRRPRRGRDPARRKRRQRRRSPRS